MGLENIIVVEDNEDHINDAVNQIGNEIKIARNFAEFEQRLDEGNIRGILSDLYFPTGFERGDLPRYLEIRSKVLKIINNWVSKHGYRSDSKNNPIAYVLDHLVKAGLGKTPQEALEKIKEKEKGLLDLPHLSETINDSLRRLEEGKRYVSLSDQIALGEHLMPMGIFVYEKAKKSNIQCIIVTDSYHHGTEFQPFVSSVGHYFDNLKGNSKMWSEGLEALWKDK